MRSLRQIKSRIRSIENTRKVTSALEMISVVKLNRIEHTLFALRPYYSSLELILNNLINSAGAALSPFVGDKSEGKRIGLVVITSDSGLCGTYNGNVIRLAEEVIGRTGKDKIKLILIGKKGFTFFKRYNIKTLNTYIGLNGRYSTKVCDEISNYLVNLYLAGEVDKIEVVYSHYRTALIQKPMISKFLNIHKSAGKETEYILEPGKEALLKELIPRYLSIKMRLFILEAFTSEHSARTVAMKTATDNAKELLKRLTLLRNKVRQANITQEIMEVIASVEALKG